MKFKSIDWTSDPSAPRYIPEITLGGPEFLPWQEPHMLDTLNIGSEEISSSDANPAHYDWDDIRGYTEMWNFLSSDPLERMKVEKSHEDG
ncbi:hypothetical protein PG996_007817 [Apiospora saccharicola]|uniref:Uncharacterized protein n=1 Tax=Apiospora saccharicola TaxID=335842 RepID=A0ABR1UW54_9PEZI